MSDRSFIISIICILTGTITLYDSRALFAPYLCAAVFAVFCLVRIRDRSIDRRSAGFYLAVAASFVSAVLITLANYSIWQHPQLPDERSPMFVRIIKLALILVIMSAAFVCTLAILVYTIFCREAFTVSTAAVNSRKKYLYFLIPFAVTAAVYLTVYFCCYMPGLMSVDSIDQADQIFSGNYSNHQPFYHTMILGVFLRAGLAVFGDINRAVMLYVIFQILFMAATFGYVTLNMASYGMPLWMISATTLYYALMPYHIMYSFTVWKDVYFSAFVTILILLLVRIAREGGRRGDYPAFFLFSLLICLIRSNGLFSYVFVFAGVLILMRKHRKLLVIMPSVIILAFILKHSVLGAMNVAQPDTVESLSIPLQQISRVIYDDGIMADEDVQFLSQFMDVSSVKKIYDPDISDPVKNAIRDFGNQDCLRENMGEFAKLYLRTLVHNPLTFVIAWVDSTCGYWNAGYDYWVWYWDVEANDLGIQRTVVSEGMLHFMDEYLWSFYNVRILQVFISIGIFVWLLMVLFARNLALSNTAGIIAVIPLLAVLLSLLVSSPVFSEFRYMYPLFTSLPAIIAITCAGPERSGKI